MSRPHPRHRNNAEEYHYRKQDGNPSHIANFTKCLPHEKNTGLLVDHLDYALWVKAIDSGDPIAIERLRIGPPGATDPDGRWSSFEGGKPVIDWEWSGNQTNPPDVRGWESQGAGLTFDLEGPDSHSITMPPAPRLDSQELIAEMAELYWMAVLRDIPFSEWGSNPKINQARQSLGQFYWFADSETHRLTLSDRSPEALARRRVLVQNKGDKVPIERFMRGVAPGDTTGPYLSQFLLLGNTGINKNDAATSMTDGMIAYGGIRTNQRVRVATPGKNYMTVWEEWLDVQNGANVRGKETYEAGAAYRFMLTPRDIATYVHYDALYEAYLNACVLLLGMGAPFDPGLPFERPDWQDKQQGFAQFGGPHILSLVTEVATRALKAVRYQKYNTHRRVRPEGVGGLLYQWDENELPETAVLENLLKAFKGSSGLASEVKGLPGGGGNLLLPMAFPEGSPTHPSYGAGHATVAAACVTILKAFFDAGWQLPLHDGYGKPVAYEANYEDNGTTLREVALSQPLTVEGELNKLAANIAIGRNWAGVHYYSDYFESFKLGEQVALGILEEQKLQYGEIFSMTVPLLDGSAVRI